MEEEKNKLICGWSVFIGDEQKSSLSLEQRNKNFVNFKNFGCAWFLSMINYTKAEVSASEASGFLKNNYYTERTVCKSKTRF